MKGWIKLHRSLLNWEWYDDLNATRLLIHLLVSVNYEDNKWKGIIIKAGSIVLSWNTLSGGTGLTIKQCRTAMIKLEKSGEVARQVASDYQLVSLTKWELLQSNEGEGADQRADERQDEGRQRAISKESKESKENKKKKSTPKSFMFKNSIIVDFIVFKENFVKESAYGVDLKYYYNVTKDWSETKTGIKRTDKGWIATVRTIMRRDNSEKKLVKITPVGVQNKKATDYLNI